MTTTVKPDPETTSWWGSITTGDGVTTYYTDPFEYAEAAGITATVDEELGVVLFEYGHNDRERPQEKARRSRP